MANAALSRFRNQPLRMNVRGSWQVAVILWVFSALGLNLPLYSQTESTQASKPPLWSCPDRSTSEERAVSWPRLVPNILCDQKRIWTFPARLDKRANWLGAAAVTVGTAAFILLDPSDTPYFRRTQSWGTFNNTLSSTNTALATLLVPASLYGVSLIRHDSYGQDTALLAGEAAAGAEIVAFVFKDASHRLRPQEIPPYGNFRDTWWDKTGWTGASSFPSGHEIAAFSIATVMSRRYSRHKWVPYVAYGGAALIGLSRVTTSAHFPSDVFIGAALGYAIGRVAVLH